MREIKFRAWHKRNKEFYNWGIGNIDDNGGLGTFPSDLTYLDHQQYTGLKDKNGVEIYEGDILRYEYAVSAFTIREVKFEDNSFIATRTRYGNEILSDSFAYLANKDNYKYGCRELEVIGNIYENEDLLK